MNNAAGHRWTGESFEPNADPHDQVMKGVRGERTHARALGEKMVKEWNFRGRSNLPRHRCLGGRTRAAPTRENGQVKIFSNSCLEQNSGIECETVQGKYRAIYLGTG